MEIPAAGNEENTLFRSSQESEICSRAAECLLGLQEMGSPHPEADPGGLGGTEMEFLSVLCSSSCTELMERSLESSSGFWGVQ